jgi:hypothetical protein
LSAAFTAYVGTANPTGLNGLSSSLGQKVTYASDYFADQNWAAIDDDQWVIQKRENSGYRMICAVQMLPATAHVSLATGATGAYNQYFATLARNLVAAAMGNSVLRLDGSSTNRSSPGTPPARRPRSSHTGAKS